MTRYHFPRETRAARLKVMLAQPGRRIELTEDGSSLAVFCEDAVATDELERQLTHALALMHVTGRLVDRGGRMYTIFLEARP